MQLSDCFPNLLVLSGRKFTAPPPNIVVFLHLWQEANINLNITNSLISYGYLASFTLGPVGEPAFVPFILNAQKVFLPESNAFVNSWLCSTILSLRASIFIYVFENGVLSFVLGQVSYFNVFYFRCNSATIFRRNCWIHLTCAWSNWLSETMIFSGFWIKHNDVFHYISCSFLFTSDKATRDR